MKDAPSGKGMLNIGGPTSLKDMARVSDLALRGRPSK